VPRLRCHHETHARRARGFTWTVSTLTRAVRAAAAIAGAGARSRQMRPFSARRRVHASRPLVRRLPASAALRTAKEANVRVSKRSVQTAFLAIGVLTLVVGSSTLAYGDGRRAPSRLFARLVGLEENPPIYTAARGSFSAVIHEDTETIEFTLRYSGIEGGAVSQAHIHLSPRRINGGIAAFLCGGSTKPPCPATETTMPITGTITKADVIGPTGQGVDAGEFDAFVDAIRLGHGYANVHSIPRFAGGEIRGQIQVFGRGRD
jgi:hypothetical protein